MECVTCIADWKHWPPMARALRKEYMHQSCSIRLGCRPFGLASLPFSHQPPKRKVWRVRPDQSVCVLCLPSSLQAAVCVASGSTTTRHICAPIRGCVRIREDSVERLPARQNSNRSQIVFRSRLAGVHNSWAQQGC